MNDPAYVVRAWNVTNAGHARVTVVDDQLRIAHVTIHRDAMVRADVHTLILDRLAHMPPPRRPRS